MATSINDLCNIAIGHLGVSVEVLDYISEINPIALACRRFVENDIKACLRDFPWNNFSVKLETLKYAKGLYIFNKTGVFYRPDDYIRIARIVPINYKYEDTSISIATIDISLTYITIVTETAHGLVIGDRIIISDTDNEDLDDEKFDITEIIDTTSFTVSCISSSTDSLTGGSFYKLNPIIMLDQEIVKLRKILKIPFKNIKYSTYNLILADEAECAIEYVYYNENVEEYPPDFVDMVTHKIAASIAPSCTPNSAKVVQNQLTLYGQYRLNAIENVASDEQEEKIQYTEILDSRL